jgi:hypothetical protein
MNQEEYQETLDWMLAHAIIDHITYNLLLIKALPYLD